MKFYLIIAAVAVFVLCLFGLRELIASTKDMAYKAGYADARSVQSETDLQHATTTMDTRNEYDAEMFKTLPLVLHADDNGVTGPATGEWMRRHAGTAPAGPTVTPGGSPVAPGVGGR